MIRVLIIALLLVGCAPVSGGRVGLPRVPPFNPRVIDTHGRTHPLSVNSRFVVVRRSRGYLVDLLRRRARVAVTGYLPQDRAVSAAKWANAQLADHAAIIDMRQAP